MDAKQVWRAVFGELQVTPLAGELRDLAEGHQLVEIDDNRFRIAAPNGFARDWLDNRYRPLISQTLARVVGGSVQVEFVVADAPGPARPRRRGDPTAAARSRPAATPLNLERRYVFTNFIVGIGQSTRPRRRPPVADGPGHAYNPLFLYGGVGLGKTHLMQAIGNAGPPSSRASASSTRRASSSPTTSSTRSASSKMESSAPISAHRRAAHRRHPVPRRAERTQEEFFHTFNALHEAGKQIVLSSDRPPNAITTLEERLRSRFEWGLIADLEPPDLETRDRDPAQRRRRTSSTSSRPT